MSTLGERIRAARKGAGLTQQRLADRMGMRSGNTISNWEQNTNRPDIDQLQAICDALEVPLDYILDWKGGSSGPRISPAEQEFIQKYRQLDEYGAKALDLILEIEYERCIRERRTAAQAAEKAQKAEKVAARPIRVAARQQHSTGIEADEVRSIQLHGKAAAGPGTWLTGEVDDIQIVVNDSASRRADFAVEVVGDSMEPAYHSGDILLVESTPSIDPGELGIFSIGDEGFFKKLGHGALLSLNPKYDPILVDSSTEIWGRVIGKAERADVE